MLARTLDVLHELPELVRRDLVERVGLDSAELDLWDDVSRRLHVPFHSGVISQFEGYGDLAELDWAGYRERYGDIRRLDRILEAEGDSVNGYRASKQADVLMLGYLFSPAELGGLFQPARVRGRRSALAGNRRPLSEPYEPRVDAEQPGARLGAGPGTARRGLDVHPRSPARRRRRSPGRHHGEGVHLGAMAGTLDLVQRGLTGLETRGGALRFDPVPLPELSEYGFAIRYRGHRGVQLRLSAGRLHLSVPASDEDPIDVTLADRTVSVAPGESCTLTLPER